MTKEWKPLQEEDMPMIRALAQVVIVDRMNRAMVVGTTQSGRTMVEFQGEQTEAERLFFSLCKPPRTLGENIAGGMFNPAAQELIEKQRKEQT